MKYQLLFLTLAISCESFNLFKRHPQCSEKNEVDGDNSNARKAVLKVCGLPENPDNLAAASIVIKSNDSGSHNCEKYLEGKGFICNGSLYSISGIPSELANHHGGICLSVKKCKDI